MPTGLTAPFIKSLNSSTPNADQVADLPRPMTDNEYLRRILYLANWGYMQSSGGGGGGGGGATGSVTNPGVSGTVAQAIQGITGGVPITTYTSNGALETGGNLASILTKVSNIPASPATAGNQTSVIGTLAPGTSATNSSLIGVVYNSTPPTLTNGQQVAAQADSAGNLQIATSESVLSLTPTVTVTTYAANKCIGGLAPITGALRAAKNTGVLNSIQINFNTTAPTQGFTVAIFSANPTSSTFLDNTIASIANADNAKLLGTVSLTAFTNTLGTHTSYTATGIGLSLIGTAGTIYVTAICQGASIMATSTTFTNITFGILQD